MWLSPPPISPLFPYTTLFRSPIRRGIIFLAAIRPHRVGDGTHCPRAVDPLRFPSGAGLGRRARDRAVSALPPDVAPAPGAQRPDRGTIAGNPLDRGHLYRPARPPGHRIGP